MFAGVGPSSAHVQHAPDPTSGVCSCPACALGTHMYHVYNSQNHSSPTVMSEHPYNPETTAPPNSYDAKAGPPVICQPDWNGFSAPPSHVINGSTGFAVSRGCYFNDVPYVGAGPGAVNGCPMYEAYGFCMYGTTCLLPHRAERPPIVPPANTVDGLVKVVFDVALQHEDDKYDCAVCGYQQIPEEYSTKVGETSTYRFCPACTSVCYHPFLVWLIEAMIRESRSDYQTYKDLHDRIRPELPDVIKIAFSYECHRFATTVFAWSCCSILDAAHALQTCDKYFPSFNKIVSVGAGTGYVEHVFHTAANVQKLVPFSTPHKKVYFFAFDEVVRPARYSIFVNYGSPQSLLSLDCSDAVLLLCWPPFGSPQEEQSSMGFEALHNYLTQGGTMVIYIGDVGSTGDWRFHELLFREFSQVKEYRTRKELRRWHPQDMGLIYAGCDTIGVYQKRSVAIVSPQWTWNRL